jgi:diaminopimelate epimerase
MGEQQFRKYQATGNDFIILGDVEATFPDEDEQLIARLCHRQFGIGADGLILARQRADGHFRMVYFNADGKQATMCGNGGRCFARFVLDTGLQPAGEFSFEAVDGWHTAYGYTDGQVTVSMQPVSGIRDTGRGLVLDTGSPHYLVFEDVASVKAKDVDHEGQAIRNAEAFREAGINVNFVGSPAHNRLYMRTYERGVESETLSCGTGVVAAALGQAYQHSLNQGPVYVQTPGGHLSVDFRVARQAPFQADQIQLTGPASFVFRGSISLSEFF